MPQPIYMDSHATTPLDPRVLEAMMPYLTDHFGNAASSTHLFGEHAKGAVDAARGQVADLIGCSEAEIIFTSGATESDNLAVKELLTSTEIVGIISSPVPSNTTQFWIHARHWRAQSLM